MDTRLATNQIRLSEWTRIIKDRCQSGLKVDEYCEQHQLSRHAYYYWLRKKRQFCCQGRAISISYNLVAA